MANSKITIFSAVIVPLIVIAATIALAFVWSDEGAKSTLFWVNLGYGVLLEAIFFGYLAMIRWGRESFTGAFYSIMGVCAVYYITAGALLMAFSSLMSLKLYVTVITVLTLIWLVVGALIAETDSRHQEDVDATKEKNRKLMNK